MMTTNAYVIPAAPLKKAPVRELLSSAGLDVSEWAFDRNDDVVINPNNNIGRNSNWSFIGEESEPTVLCIWYDLIDWRIDPPVFRGNEYKHRDYLIELAGIKKGKDGLGRLKGKIRQCQLFHKAVYHAKSHSRMVRVILVDGERVPTEKSAEKSSTVKARSLDHPPWYVHECDGKTGDFLIVRGVAPILNVIDPLATLVDPGENPALHAFLATLGETEREAVIKARVGQGPFRDGLIDRWRGCSVTGCGLIELLVASHIKPWSKCETAAERLGAANGLLLVPNLDKLFDKGLISFGDDFRIIYSSQLKDGFAQMLNVDRHMRLKSAAHTDMLPFLAWHRQHIFRQ